MVEEVPAAVHPDATVEELRRGLALRLLEIVLVQAGGAHVATGGTWGVENLVERGSGAELMQNQIAQLLVPAEKRRRFGIKCRWRCWTAAKTELAFVGGSLSSTCLRGSAVTAGK